MMLYHLNYLQRFSNNSGDTETISSPFIFLKELSYSDTSIITNTYDLSSQQNKTREKLSGENKKETEI
jgi:hypothetical protein